MPRKNVICLINKRPPSLWVEVPFEMAACLYAGRYDGNFFCAGVILDLEQTPGAISEYTRRITGHYMSRTKAVIGEGDPWCKRASSLRCWLFWPAKTERGSVFADKLNLPNSKLFDYHKFSLTWITEIKKFEKCGICRFPIVVVSIRQIHRPFSA